MPDTVEKTVTDAWVFEAKPTANFGQQANLALDATVGSRRYAYIDFGLPFNPGGDPNLTVFTATLTLYLSIAWPGSNTITIERIIERWSENGIRWSNVPAIDVTNAATISITGGAAGDAVTADLTPMLGDVAAGAPFFGIRLRVGTSAIRALYAAENPNKTRRAMLEIDWSRTPLAPVNLSPSGNLAVSLAKPILDWQFDSKDHSTLRRQSYSQVQVSTTSSFASPAYDSGKVANTLSSWNLNAASSPTFTALSDGDNRWWRVRVWDDRGQVSDYSDPVQFNRTTKGTLTISNPPAPAGNIVNETTPPITFSLSGRTQEAVKIVLFQFDGSNLIEKWTYGKRVTTDNAIDVPAGIIKTSEEYRVGVAVWDTIDRAQTQGDPDYVLATRDFTYQRAGTIASVTNLTAVQFGPGALLTWHRTAAPLYFCLKVNGQEVNDRIDPDNVHVSGDKYQMAYYGAVSGDNNLYEVEAVESAGGGPHAGQFIHSDGNDTDRLTLDIQAKWLVDDDLTDSSAIQIFKRDQVSFKKGKSATVYNTVGGQRPFEFIDAVRGYEGTVSGWVESTDVADKLDAMVRKAKPLRYIQSTVNIPVEIQGEPDIAPDSESIGDSYIVSFDIAQIGEFPRVPGA